MRRAVNAAGLALFAALGLLSLAPLALVVGDVLYRGLAAMWKLGPGFLTALPPTPLDESGGVGPALAGTLYMTALGALAGFLLGFPIGVYIGEYRWELAARLARVGVNVLVEFPTITIGLFVYSLSGLLTPALRALPRPPPPLDLFVGPPSVFNAYAGAAALALIMTPYVALFTASAYASVAAGLREAVYSIAGDERRALFVAMRKVLSRVITAAALLGTAKIAGETAPLLFTAGYSNYYGPFTRETASIPVLIYRSALAPYPIYHEVAYAAAALLLLLVLAAYALAQLAAKR
ncbi:phosphate ABC transporter permease [Pyrobaculum neutrophilum]|uniref:Binding-protein-dependent transport systems inner membrane component n=1 Tax=Pyrobaculum neutrophilum (strain DSM 2338 / JCM 9278 / NBRC 100436 / V24Sta) TaxID=444157 RepID=B1YBT0_PYRNV|nr:phosphate ABC transporter permease [Pyrobaculum neutrophilum]ACB39314.1 binding-protein-dependent transport systems inner membrane component [Pyrobaculum neutrophilum V24Sta]